MKSLILSSIVVAASVAAAAHATTYYVSPTGNDSASGTLSTLPWKTVAHVNAFRFQSGDEILFQRGGTWREMLNPLTSGLTFSAYGTGAKPVISGANLLATGWKLSNGNIWSYPLGAYQPTQVWFNTVLGSPASSTAEILGPGQWFYGSNTLYVYSAGNPATAYTSPGIEATQRDEALTVGNIGNITVENIAFVNAAYTDIYLSSGVTGFQNFNSVLFQGAEYEGFLAAGGTPQITGSEGIYNGEGIGIAGGEGLTLNNSILSGNSTDALEIYGTNAASVIESSTITGNSTNTPSYATISNWSSFPLTAGNSVLLPNPYYPTVYSFTGLTDEGTNVYESPLFTTRAAPLMIIPYIDDYINLGVAQAVAAEAATYGCPISYALNTKLVTAADWQSIAALQAAGNEIVAHTRSHPDLANNSVFTIQYLGTASTAQMTINQTSGTLQTFLNGSNTPDLNIPISDTYDDVLNLCSQVTANPNYTCVIQTNQEYFTPAILANVSLANIATPYVAQASAGYLTWEVEGSKSDIQANIPGYTVTSFATPFTSSNATVETHVQNAGFLTNRNGTLTATGAVNGNWLLSNLDIYNIAADWLPEQYDATNPGSSVGALVEGLGAVGGVFAVYAHGFDEFTLAQWQQLFATLKQVGGTCVTMSQARTYIQSHGTLLPDGTKKNWVEMVPLQPNYSTTAASPTQGAHNLQ
jgi:hypothetical protein